MLFKNRVDAGEQLAQLLHSYLDKGVVVFALPRGGVIVASEIAKSLKAPLDLIITRKIGHPEQSEFAIAAISENGSLVINPEYEQLTETQWFSQAVESEKVEAKRRHEIYLKGRQPVFCNGKTAIIVDDGVATGLTLKAAIGEIKKLNPKEIIVALPVIPEEVAAQIESQETVKIIAKERTNYFKGSVGAYYQEFSQITDDEVVNIMDLHLKKL